MWVHAPAGYGKTAIAGTISKMLEETVGLDFSPLEATFFFWRASFERNSPTRFIIAITYQLAMSIPELKPHIESAVNWNPMILRKAPEVQLVKLIVEPFKALGELENIPNRLVTIDGLDECIKSGHESPVEKKNAEDQRKFKSESLISFTPSNLIYALQPHRLPLSFLILSRPEIWIKQHIVSRSFTNLVEVVDLYAVGDHMKDAENIQDKRWPTEDIVHGFVRRTNGHMLYASTVIRHIDNQYDGSRESLRNILDSSSKSNSDLAHSTAFSSLHELYRQIMRSCPETHRSLMVEVPGDIIAPRTLLEGVAGIHRALDMLDSLSSRAPGSRIEATRSLHAVIRVSIDHWNDFFYPLLLHGILNEPSTLVGFRRRQA
ncbi:hypothetical protein EST38_g11575 [Candolleomyces aberdarensis]|uniref:Nephrocystin 3-like N-terminal domain-containing protein n=1 Tax=Candolleomyces aberdarensis TaxID=2316362 RepID=A0A4Q2D6U4_9AGAR|nr:hypothetical protein EST38_g11575 [Candolleomyces aberdarensis]